jgi:hypothetical protein
MPVALLESGEDADREGTPETLPWPLAGALASEFQVRPCGNAKPSSQHRAYSSRAVAQHCTTFEAPSISEQSAA